MQDRSPPHVLAGTRSATGVQQGPPAGEPVAALACTNDPVSDATSGREGSSRTACDALAALLAQSLDVAASLDAVDREACRALCKRLTENALNLVVAGEFKRGKSSVINALLGTAVLPVGVVPLTSVVTVVCHGDMPSATVNFADGATRDIGLEQIADYVTEKGNPRNTRGVELVVVRHPSAWLRDRARVVDTPGIGSVHQHNTEVALRYLPQADAVLFVASADQPVGRAELDFLIEIRRYADKVLCVLNKTDYLAADEVREALDFTAQAVSVALQASVPVIPFSARLVLAGKETGNGEKLRAGGLPDLERALEGLLGEERRAVQLTSAARGLQRLLRSARLAIELELEALTAPIERIEANLAVFVRKKEETQRAASDNDVLFDAQLRRLQQTDVEPALEEFKRRLTEKIQVTVERCFDDARKAPLGRLQAAVETQVIAEIRAAYDGWRTDRDAILARRLGHVCERFSDQAQAIVDELSRSSADLFALRFESTPADATWRPRPDFQYKFWSEPTGLGMLAASLVRLLPRFLAEPLVRRHVREWATELVDTQAGRVRYDFAQQFHATALRFRSDMRARTAATTAGIERAIVDGVALRKRGVEESADRRQSLIRSLAAIDTQQRHLSSVTL